MHGNYLHIVDGKVSRGIRYMLGGPETSKDTNNMSSNDIWEFIRESKGKGSIITAQTNPGKGPDNWGILMD